MMDNLLHMTCDASLGFAYLFLRIAPLVTRIVEMYLLISVLW